MFCTQCGKELKDGLKFCPNCGTLIKSRNNASQNDNQVNTLSAIENVSQEKVEAPTAFVSSQYEKPKKTNKGIFVIIIILILLIIGVSGAAFWFMGGKDVIYDVLGYQEIEDVDTTEKEIEDEDIAADNVNSEKTEDLDEVNKAEVAESEENENSEDDLRDINVEDAEENQVDEVKSEYILENSDTKYLTRDDLEWLTADDCRLARNELYARHGRKFDDESLQSYFDSCSWYEGTIEAKDFQESMLSDIEIANRDLIVEYENEMGFR